jgi:hypothetical protein
VLEDRHDVRVVEGGLDLDLPTEPRECLGVVSAGPLDRGDISGHAVRALADNGVSAFPEGCAFQPVWAAASPWQASIVAVTAAGDAAIRRACQDQLPVRQGIEVAKVKTREGETILVVAVRPDLLQDDARRRATLDVLGDMFPGQHVVLAASAADGLHYAARSREVEDTVRRKRALHWTRHSFAV